MSAVALPRHAAPARHRRARRRAGGLILLARLAACGAAAATAVTTVRENMRFRIFEAWLSGHVIALATSVRATSVPGAPITIFAYGPHRYLGMYITTECTVAILIVPFLVGTAWMMWHHAKFVRPIAALAIAAVMLVALNQLRLLTIATLIMKMGDSSGFYWGHTLIGSLITVFGVVVVFCCYALLAAGRSPLHWLRGTRRAH